MTSTDTHTAAAALEQILDERYSCRGFLPDRVSDATLEQIFTMSQRTASWCNSQAWQVELVSGSQRDEFAAFLGEWVGNHDMGSDFPAPDRYDGVYGDRRRASGYGLYNALGIAREDRDARATQMLKNYDFFGAPHVAIITSDAGLGVYGAIDCGAYVSTLLTSATSVGVATCAQAALALYSDGIREFLDLPEDRLVVCGVAIGYADPDHPANSFRTEREPISGIVNYRG